MKRKLRYIIYLIFPIVIAACEITPNHTSQTFSNEVSLSLLKSTFSDIDEIDTIDVYPKMGIYIFQLTRRGHLGNYTITYGLEKQIGQNHSNKLRYEADDRELCNIPAQHGLWFWYDKDFLLLMDRKLSDVGYGWFRMKGGKKYGWEIVDYKANKIIDSFKKSDTGYYSSFADGSVLHIYRNGILVQETSYENITAQYKLSNYVNLEKGLYKLINDSLAMVSKEPNDIVKREDGIYFVPTPGYGVRCKYNKKEILHLIDSVSKISSPPEKLLVKPVK